MLNRYDLKDLTAKVSKNDNDLNEFPEDCILKESMNK